jgi:hypothetical protein
MKHIVGTKKDVEAAQVDVDTMMDYPRMSVPSGSGRHVDAPEVFASGAPGWTPHQRPIRKHPAKDEYAMAVDDDTTAALVDPEKRKRITADKLAALDAKQAAAKDLPADWGEQGEDE